MFYVWLHSSCCHTNFTTGTITQLGFIVTYKPDTSKSRSVFRDSYATIHMESTFENRQTNKIKKTRAFATVRFVTRVQLFPLKTHDEQGILPSATHD